MCDAGLAASANVVGVSLGGILGHCMCTGGAVLGGRQMAAYVAERTLAVIFFWLRAAALGGSPIMIAQSMRMMTVSTKGSGLPPVEAPVMIAEKRKLFFFFLIIL